MDRVLETCLHTPSQIYKIHSASEAPDSPGAATCAAPNVTCRTSPGNAGSSLLSKDRISCQAFGGSVPSLEFNDAAQASAVGKLRAERGKVSMYASNSGMWSLARNHALSPRLELVSSCADDTQIPQTIQSRSHSIPTGYVKARHIQRSGCCQKRRHKEEKGPAGCEHHCRKSHQVSELSKNTDDIYDSC